MTAPGDTSPDSATDPEVMERVWDEKYSESERIWSGDPNGTLVSEISDLSPGRALDVGCGEGADAVWLAGRGWQVVALDVSGVALQRGEQAAKDAGVYVEWIHTGLIEADLPHAGFDLVSAQYPVLPRTPEAIGERTLADSVAPGGTLLFVHHAQFGTPAESGQAHNHHHADDGDHAPGAGPPHEFDPATLVGVEDMRRFLATANGWTIDTHEVRPRDLATGAGAHHTEDVVLRAIRS